MPPTASAEQDPGADFTAHALQRLWNWHAPSADAYAWTDSVISCGETSPLRRGIIQGLGFGQDAFTPTGAVHCPEASIGAVRE